MKHEVGQMILIMGLFLLLSIFIVTTWLPGSSMIMGHDSGYRLVIAEFFKSLVFTWVPALNFGISALFNPAVIPIHLPEVIASVIVHNDEFVQRLVLIFWHWINVSAVLIAYLIIRPKLSRSVVLTAVIASFLYGINFLNLHAWSVLWRTKFSTQFVLPLLVLFLHDSLEKNSLNIRKLIVVVMFTALCNGGGSPPLYGPLFVAWIATGLYSIFISSARKKTAWVFVKVTLLIALIFAVLSAFWLIPYVAYAISSYSIELKAQGGVESLIGLVDAVSKNASILNIFRLQGLPSWDGQTPLEFIHPYLNNPFLILGSFVWPILAVGAYFFAHERREKQLVLLMFVLLLIGMFFTAGSHPPTGALFTFMMSIIPGFGIFRTAFYKFGMIPWFSMSVLSAFTLIRFSKWIGQRSKRNVLQPAVIVGFLMFVFAYYLPFIQGNFFDYNLPFTNKVILPKYIKETSDFIHATTSIEDKILLLPRFDLDRMDGYTWGYWGPDPLPRMTINRAIVSDANNPPLIVDAIYRALYEKRLSDFLTLLQISGIHTILWRSDALYTDKISSGEQFAYLEAELQTIPQIELSATFDKWRVYTVQNDAQWPHLMATGNYVKTDVQYEEYLDAVGARAKPILISPGHKIMADELIKAECIFCDFNEKARLESSVDVLHVQFLPDSKVYFIVQWLEKRKLRELSAQPHLLIRAYYALIQVRISEIHEYLTKGDPDKYVYIESGVKRVKDLLVRAKKLFPLLPPRQENELKAEIVQLLRGYQFVAGRLYGEKNIEPSLVELRAVIAGELQILSEDAWYTKDDESRAFIADVTQDGVYEVIVRSDNAAAIQLYIDGQYVSKRSLLNLSRGVHRIALFEEKTSFSSTSVPRVYLVAKSLTSQAPTPKARYVMDSPTRYRVHISGADGPFVLHFGELFDAQWSAYVLSADAKKQSKKMRIDEGDHLKTNGFGNGWYIDNVGEYDIIIEYSPQTYVSIGFVISAFGWATCCGYLFIRRKNI